MNTTKTLYHVFTHEADEWFESLAEAGELYTKWAKEMGDARLYEEINDKDGDLISEDCLYATGDFPA